ncbi:MAG TPA: hypothetical protein VG838_13955 [Opitutaceae bacterium]|nr:hypothetical protein [Opitutaceae bacterium]
MEKAHMTGAHSANNCPAKKMSTPTTPASATPHPYIDWFTEHIPHRVRAAIAGTEMLARKLEDRFGKGNVRTAGVEVHVQLPADAVALYCVGNAIWEGRMTATRWLIDFVDVSCDKNGNPSRPNSKPHDWRIAQMGSASFPLTDPNARKLADVWLGCTKATSHPTRGSGHPPVDPNELNAAVAIVMDYLDLNLYRPAGRNLLMDVLVDVSVTR